MEPSRDIDDIVSDTRKASELDERQRLRGVGVPGRLRPDGLGQTTAKALGRLDLNRREP
jgi:hypothetical protein